MPTFSYTARGNAKEIVQGVIVAANQQAAVMKILQLGQTPLGVKQEDIVDSNQRGASVNVFFKKNQVPLSALAVFSKSLSDLIESGIALPSALDLLGRQQQPPALTEAIGQMKQSVKDGSSLSRALTLYPDIFNQLYVNMIKSAELVGNLPKTLMILGLNIEKEIEVKNKIQSVLLYPSMILGVGVLAVVVLLTFVLPKLSVMFEDFGADLPLPTRLVIALSDFLLHYGGFLVIFLLLAVYGMVRYSQTAQGQMVISRFLLKIPLVKDFVSAAETARYARTLAVLLESGVPITQALESSARVLDNALFTAQASEVAQQVRMGTNLSNAIRDTHIFGELAVSLITVGEKGGHLEGNLYKLSVMNEAKTQKMTDIFLSVLGPIVLIGVVGVVGMFMIAMLLPIIQMDMIIK